MQEVVEDLHKTGQLIKITKEVDGNLEAAQIHREIFDKAGPAIFFEKIKGSPFPAVSNIYGTFERTEYLFRHTLRKVKRLIELKADPARLLKNPLKYISAPLTALMALPMKTGWSVPSKFGQTQISKLPMIKSWSMDGGAFITMPQVFTMPPGSKDIMQSNVGMYRIQLNGNEYVQDEEIGLHYQLHRGIGVHHTAYNESNLPFKCSIFVGGLPSHAFAAIMPMPEGMSELTFAGMLGGRRFRYSYDDQGHVISNDADFVITGTILKNIRKPEGPFGDHLGYYSLKHDFPVMKVDRVYHRKNPIWHFSVVGRPPMEDSSFGHLIHKLVEDLIPVEFPGVKEIHAVDAAGVHPLLLAIGKERYMPFREKIPEEILTIASKILGSGQTSLTKYLIIAAEDEYKELTTYNIPAFFQHVLERIDWRRDLHFHTKTTIDTLDYSGVGWNAGSKVVIACRGEKKRTLGPDLNGIQAIKGIQKMALALPGVLCIEHIPWIDYPTAISELANLSISLQALDSDKYPLIVLCDDADFTAATVNNFLWVTFTRSNPSHDIYGVDQFIEYKHWGCAGSLIIDARKKKHHAPELID